MANFLVTLLAVVMVGAQQSYAAEINVATHCAGFELFTDKVKTCDGVTSLLTFDQFNVTMADNCTFVTQGSIDYKSFATAKLDYNINFASAKLLKSLIPEFPLSYSNFDLCTLSSLIPSNFMKYITNLGLPSTCPVTGKTIRADNLTTNLDILTDLVKQGINIRPFLGMAVATGYTTGKVNVVTDTGVGCFEFAGAIRKKATDASRKTDALKKMTQKRFDDLKNKMMKKMG